VYCLCALEVFVLSYTVFWHYPYIIIESTHSMIYAALSPILGENIVHYMHYGKYSTVQHFHLVWLHTIHTFLGADVVFLAGGF